MIRKLNLALVAGSALITASCTEPTETYDIPARTVDAPQDNVPSAASSEVLESYLQDREMLSCITNAPPRVDGKPSQLAGVRDGMNDYTAVREVWSDGEVLYTPGNPGADTRANHLGHCVTRANTITRPAVIPHSEEDPIFQPQ